MVRLLRGSRICSNSEIRDSGRSGSPIVSDAGRHLRSARARRAAGGRLLRPEFDLLAVDCQNRGILGSFANLLLPSRCIRVLCTKSLRSLLFCSAVSVACGGSPSGAAGGKAASARAAKASELTVRVVDFTGSALAGASSPDAPALAGPTKESMFSVRAGRAHQFSAPGHLTAESAVDPGQAVTPVVLWPASSLEGRVIVEGGRRPASGVALRLWDWTDGAQDLEVSSDSEGRFEFPALRPGRYQLFVDDEELGGQVPVTVGLATHQKDLVVGAHRKVEVSGRVFIRDEHGQRPCTQGKVDIVPGRSYWKRDPCSCGDRAHGLKTSAVADDGELAFFVDPDSSYSIRISCQGAMATFPRPLKVGRRTLRGRRWTLSAGRSRPGRVVAPDGRPVVGAEVWADTDGSGVGQTAITDDDGLFELGGMKTTLQRVRVTSMVDGRSVEYTREIDFRSREKPTEIIARWPRSARSAGFEFEMEQSSQAVAPTCPRWPMRSQPVRGKVIDAGGRAVAGAVLVPVRKDVELGATLAAMGSDSGCRPVLSDAGGAFVLDAFPESPFALVALGRGGGVARVEIAEPQHEQTVELHPFVRVRLDIRDSRGEPALHVAFGDQHLYAAKGSFELPGLLSGRWRVELADADEHRASEAFDLPAGGDVVEVLHLRAGVARARE